MSVLSQELQKHDLPRIAHAVKLQLDAYVFPVVMLVTHPNGTVINGVNANDFLEIDEKDVDPAETQYVPFVCQGYGIKISLNLFVQEKFIHVKD